MTQFEQGNAIVASHAHTICGPVSEVVCPFACYMPIKLPGGEHAIIEETKVRDYVLSSTHATGHSKSRFFDRLGFSSFRWKELEEQLLALVADGEAEPRGATQFGQKYLVRGIIRGPNGRTAGVRSIWIIRHGETWPRLVTVLPGAST